jgi:hypothetical protein
MLAINICGWVLEKENKYLGALLSALSSAPRYLFSFSGKSGIIKAAADHTQPYILIPGTKLTRKTL